MLMLAWAAAICAVLAAVLFWTNAWRYLVGAALGFGAAAFIAAFSNALSPMRFASFAGQSSITLEWLIGTLIALAGAVSCGVAWYLLRDTEVNRATGRLWFGAMLGLAVGTVAICVMAFAPAPQAKVAVVTAPKNASTSWLAKGSMYATSTAPVVGGPLKDGTANDVLAGVALDHPFVASSAPSSMSATAAAGWIQSHREWSDPFPHTDWPSVRSLTITKVTLTDLHKDVWVLAVKGITVPVRGIGPQIRYAHQLDYVVDANTGQFIGVYAGSTAVK